MYITRAFGGGNQRYNVYLMFFVILI